MVAGIMAPAMLSRAVTGLLRRRGARAFTSAGLSFQFPQGAITQFKHDGFVVINGLLDAEEVGIVKEALASDEMLDAHEMLVASGDDGAAPARQTLWTNPGAGTLGALTRSERVCGAATQLLEGNVHYYFSKRLRKLPGEDAEWKWHQDYGSYWYYDNFLRPDMLTVWIALDEATEANGCLRVVRGSHNLGRLDSSPSGNQRAADPTRVEAVLARAEHDEVAVTLRPGGALFMHDSITAGDASMRYIGGGYM